MKDFSITVRYNEKESMTLIRQAKNEKAMRIWMEAELKELKLPFQSIDIIEV